MGRSTKTTRSGNTKIGFKKKKVESLSVLSGNLVCLLNNKVKEGVLGRFPPEAINSESR